MVLTIQVKVNDIRLRKFTKKFPKTIPDELGEANVELCNAIQRNTRNILTAKNNIWRNKLYNSIQVRKLSKNRSVVKIAQEGYYLDSMTPHFVKLKSGRLIRQWAYEKGNENIKRVADRQGSIWVKPHPFMDEAIEKSLIELESIYERRVKKAIDKALN